MFVFSKMTGLFTSIVKEGKEQLAAPMAFQVFRAPTDNDRKIREIWEGAGYDRLIPKVYETTWSTEGDVVVISTRSSLGCPIVQPPLRMQTTWTIGKDGSIGMQMHVEKEEIFPSLPRFGLVFPLKLDGTASVEYYGYGPNESYIDKHEASWIGTFQTTAEAMYENYVKPQENGARHHCSWMKVENFTAEGAQAFDFSVSEYGVRELTQKMHSFELEKSGMLFVSVDYKNSGVGTASCGPELPIEYQIAENVFDWKMKYCF